MYSYCTSDEEREDFILYYEKKDDNMVVHYADNDQIVVPYTEENKNKVLTKMRKQVKNCNSFLEDVSYSRQIYKNRWVWSLGFSFTFLMLCFLGIGGLIPLFGTTLFACLAVMNLKENHVCNTYIEDIEKNTLFVEKEEEINAPEYKNKFVNITSVNLDRLLKSKEEPKFNLSTIHNLSYYDIYQIVENIKHEKMFVDKDKVKTYLKK